ncbi:MAG: hypothetical protein M1814_000185 [Vezdaea aestivalis]|nr:MAG: hypothetical protein M1814_000185 [Vezdaea aestivalis]
MAPTPTPSTDDSQLALLLSLSITETPKPFRSSSWKPAQRRNKTLTQMITDSSRREAASILATQNNSGAATPSTGGTGTATPAIEPRHTGGGHATQSLSTQVLERNLAAVVASAETEAAATGSVGPAATYTNIESAPSLHPGGKRHYCDITGLPAPYTDPKTRLRYFDKEMFGVVRGLGQGVAEMYLEARGAHTILK